MRKWETPRAEVEEFMPNEYCSTCWGVACNIGPANEYDKNYKDVSHDATHCGTATNQVVRDWNSDGTPDVMQEIGTDGLGTLNCEIYSDPAYSQSLDVSDVHPGNYIYWTTSTPDGKRTWHHQGPVQASFENHPNRS